MRRSSAMAGSSGGRGSMLVAPWITSIRFGTGVAFIPTASAVYFATAVTA